MTKLTLTRCAGGGHVTVETDDGYQFDMTVADLLQQTVAERTRDETIKEEMKAEITRTGATTFEDAKTAIEAADFETVKAL